MVSVFVTSLAISMLLPLAALVAITIARGRDRATTRLEGEALEDALTGIGNRRALFRSGPVLLAEARRGGRPTALLLMDIDGLKLVNDVHGHEAGDRLLVAFARLAHDYLPPTSLVCRIGGGEFAALLPGADGVRARSVADEIRALFAHVTLPGRRGPVRTTVSIGAARSADRRGSLEPDMEQLLDRAGRCLSAAKDGGRNRVVDEGGAGPRQPAGPVAGTEESFSVA